MLDRPIFSMASRVRGTESKLIVTRGSRDLYGAVTGDAMRADGGSACCSPSVGEAGGSEKPLGLGADTAKQVGVPAGVEAPG